MLVSLWLAASAVTLAQKPELVVQTGHSASVRLVAFSPDGKILASASGRVIKLWEAVSGQELRTLNGHTDSVSSIAFTPDSKVLISSGGTDAAIKFWDVISGAELRSLKKHSTLIYSMALSADGRAMASLAVDGLRLWNPADDSSERIAEGGTGAVSFSPDGKMLASIIYGKLQLWNVAANKESRLLGRAASVLAFSPDGKILATQDGDDAAQVALWDTSTGVKLKTLDGHAGKVYALAYSADGKTLASTSKDKVKLWDVATGKEVRALEANTQQVYSVAFSPDSKTLASGNLDQTIRLWNVESGQLTLSLDSHAPSAGAVAFSPNGRYLASLNRGLRLWDMTAGNQLRSLGDSTQVSSFAFSPDSKFLVGGGEGALTIWDVASGTKGRTIKGLPGVFKFALSPDGKLAAIDAAENEIVLWNLALGRKYRTLVNTSTSSSVAFSSNSKVLACKGNDGTTIVWDITSGRKLKALNSQEVAGAAVALSSDGKLLASAVWDGVVIWDVLTGRKIRALKEEVNYYTAIAFGPDDKSLVVGNDDGAVKLFDATTGERMALVNGLLPEWINLGGHFAVRNIEGHSLVALRESGRIRLLNPNAKQELVSLIAFDEQDWMVVAPDGLFDGSAAAWRRILWRFNSNTFDVAPVEIFFNEFYYPGLLSDTVAGKQPRAAADISQKDRRQPELKLALSGEQSAANLPVATRNIKVSINITNAQAGAQDVRLFRNGSLVKAWRGDALKGHESATLEAVIPIIAGENQLTAYAFNRDNIKSRDALLNVNGAASLKRAGTAYVLTVGVNAYANQEFNLRYAVPDAEMFGAEISRQQAGLGHFAQTEVVPLLDNDASKANILLALKRLAGTDTAELSDDKPAALRKLKPAQPEDAVIIYFSGHGLAVAPGFYLIPTDLGYAGARTRDGITANLQTILSHSISDRELEDVFEKIDAGQLVLVIDACNSGQALEAEEKRRGPMNSKGLAQLAYEKGMWILTAAESQQVAVAPKKLGHGYLTYALIEEGVRGARADKEPGDGVVYLREWFDYAAQRVPQMQEEGERERRILEQEEETQPKDKSGQRAKKDEVQRPRAFYRREVETQPLVIAASK